MHTRLPAAALCLILRKGQPGDSYNVTAECERRNIDVVRAICRALDELQPG